MGTSPYVCCPGCVILEDDFNRAAIGCRWITASGSWSIVSNQLKANSTGFIYTQAQHDLRRRNVSVKVKNVQAGKVYRLAAAVAEDGRDYLYVELSCGSGGQSTLRLGTLSGGVIDEYVVGLSAGGNYRLFACLTDEGAFGGLAEVSAPVWGCVSFHGPRAGIVNLGNAAEYDDFGFYQHAADSPGDSRCQACLCDCHGHCLPKTLTVTLESTCQHRDGLTCTLSLDKTAYPYFVWYGETEWPEPLSPNLTASYQFRLFCPWGVDTGCDEGEFALCVALFHGSCTTSDWNQGTEVCGFGRCADTTRCDPLKLRFGPATCQGSGPNPPQPCTETLVVTE